MFYGTYEIGLLVKAAWITYRNPLPRQFCVSRDFTELTGGMAAL